MGKSKVKNPVLQALLDDVARSVTIAHRGTCIDLLLFALRDGSSGFADSLNRRAWEAIFETIFSTVLVDKVDYYTTTKNKTIKGRARSHLERSAKAVRDLAHLAVGRIRITTVKLILSHIIQVLPHSGALVEPLTMNYLKALSCILEFRAHTEHLRDLWQPVLLFSLESLERLQALEQTSSLTHSASQLRVRVPIVKSGESQQDAPIPEPRLNIDKLIACIRLLNEVSNPPTYSLAGRVIGCLSQYLQTVTSYGRAHVDALAGINCVLEKLMTVDLKSTSGAIHQVVPALANLWFFKSLQLRDEVLRFLILTRPHLRKIFEGPNVIVFAEHLNNLLDALWQDYSQRASRDQLRLSDVALTRSSWHFSSPLGVSDGFLLRGNDARADSQSACVYFLAFLSLQLDTNRATTAQADRAHDDIDARKRLRGSNVLDDYIRACSSSGTGIQVSTLQLMAVRLLLSSHAQAEEVDHVVSFAVDHCSGSDAVVASWSYVVLALCTWQKLAKMPHLASTWSKAWKLSCGAVTNLPTSRASCFLLGRLIESSLLDHKSRATSLEVMILMPELAGPAVLSDSSIELWQIIVAQRLPEQPNIASELSPKLLQWLFNKWASSAFDDQIYILSEAFRATAREILSFLQYCTGHEFLSKNLAHFRRTGGMIAQAWTRARSAATLSSYLLMDDSQAFSTCDTGISPLVSMGTLCSVVDEQLDVLLLDYCHTEAVKTLRNLHELSKLKSTSISQNTISVITVQCVVYDHIRAVFCDRVGGRKVDLAEIMDTLSSDLVTCLSRPDIERTKLDACLEALSSILPVPWDTKADAVISERFELVVQLHQLFERRSQSYVDHNESRLNEEMSLSFEVDDAFGRISTESSHQALVGSLPHDLIAAESHALTFPSMVRCSLQFVATLLDKDRSSSSATALSSFLDNASTFPVQDLFLSWRVIKMSLRSLRETDVMVVTRLFERVLKVVTSDYLHERNEVALELCVDLLIITATLWLPQHDTPMGLLAGHAYHWLLSTALGGSVVSSPIECRIVDLCFEVVRLQGPEFRSPLSSMNVREQIVQLMAKDVTVMWQISRKLPSLFQHYALNEHEGILDAIWTGLSIDPTSYERMGVRLHIFANLAAHWQTLLRRCVYHIFESAGRSKDLTTFAKAAMHVIAEALKLKHERELFVLFAPQLLYSWLAEEPVAKLPYSIFGFPTLEALVLEVRSEITAQACMRTDHRALEELSSILMTDKPTLMVESFGQTAAYCLAQDSENKRKGLKGNELEATLIRGVGNDDFVGTMQNEYPHVLAIVVLSSNGDMEEKLLKQFQTYEKKNLGYAYDALLQMQSSSESSLLLPPDHQPAFHTKGLLDSIHKITRRSGRSFDHLFSAPIFVYVLRIMLQRLHPALGSLHTCSMVRKIRVFIALAGRSALSGYPLEMALHALRPLLTDIHCGPDASRIWQYMLSYGQLALVESVPFVVGHMTAVLLSLRTFSRKERDAAQSHEDSITVNKAADLRRWLIETWLPGYFTLVAESNISLQDLKSFRDLVECAAHGHQDVDTSAAIRQVSLLCKLLHPDMTSLRLLSAASQRSILKLCCDDFEIPSTPQDDATSLDPSASVLASRIWQYCVKTTVNNDGFLTWAGKIIGDARLSNDLNLSFRSTTRSPMAILSKSSNGSSGVDSARASKEVILICLIDALVNDDRTLVGFAESTLRSLLMLSESTNEFDSVSDVVPSWLFAALRLNKTGTIDKSKLTIHSTSDLLVHPERLSVDDWVLQILLAVIKLSTSSFLECLIDILCGKPNLGKELLAPIIHVALCEAIQDSEGRLKSQVSRVFSRLFLLNSAETAGHISTLIEVILYLRQCPHPTAIPLDAWTAWLDIEYLLIAGAAEMCGMHSAALLFRESNQNSYTRYTEPHNLPSSGINQVRSTMQNSHDLLLSIFRSIDEPDSFYGVHRGNSLAAVVERLDYEMDGFKSLLFHSAQLGSDMRQLKSTNDVDTSGVVQALSLLNLNSVNHAVLRGSQQTHTSAMMEQALSVAQNLEQWDFPVPQTCNSGSAVLFRVYQQMSGAVDVQGVHHTFNSAIVSQMRDLSKQSNSPRQIQDIISTLAILTELGEVMGARSYSELQIVLDRMRARDAQLVHDSSDQTVKVHACRDTAFSMLAANKDLQAMLHISETEARSIQVRSILDTCAFSLREGIVNECLSSATYLNDLIPICRSLGLDIEAQAQEMIADILWSQSEQTTAIHMLESLVKRRTNDDLMSDDLSNATILAKLGRHIGEARLETSAQIIQRYLHPALESLHGLFTGPRAGRVLHDFAAFCDQELHNSGLTGEFKRLKETRVKRRKEMDLHHSLARAAKTKTERDKLTRDAKIATRWYKIDGEEYDRVTAARENLIQQCIENYIRSLSAWDDCDSDVLRLFSIWLEHAQHSSVNELLGSMSALIPSAKFAVLVNQLTSLLQENTSKFADNVKALMLRICTDHPHHSLHHIFATLNNQQQNDGSSESRKAATEKVVERMRAISKAKDLWNRFWQADTMYHALATYTDRSKLGSGKAIPLEKVSPSATLVAKIKALRVPPATMIIPVQRDLDYSHVPLTIGFKPKMTIASGISAPKILTAMASDGKLYRQLYKAGNDDLRQDAIMEQVFDQVSQLLKKHAPTRQRRLHIRTYKVLPLSGNSGVIEFVQNTIPLSDYLQPAHQRYHPSDWTWSRCREKLHSIAQQTTDAKAKLKVFKEIQANFTPVLRLFFLERFIDPDEWFQRRLAYARSTAAISILGHVLGLGDRHCHNILLDEKSGEAVHIDLGIAFEAGRILPVPEVVPFRLSRDIVDGFGITKTEGVFRRCSEFTFDALRAERESIMTLLNVLRYDPLVNWTVSPLRAKRLQSEDAGITGMVNWEQDGSKDDEGPAGRALDVVEKKLTQMMSTAAIVSELIQQASDERNLAVLYSGWAPWA